tara:strand:+ start:36 stop:254 length:219 start_codon:yes stop_codon:yes gene_type:complete
MGQVTKWQKGIVTTVFDNDECYITCSDGERYYCSEHQNDINIQKGEAVLFKLYINRYMKQVDQLKRGHHEIL